MPNQLSASRGTSSRPFLLVAPETRSPCPVSRPAAKKLPRYQGDHPWPPPCFCRLDNWPTQLAGIRASLNSCREPVKQHCSSFGQGKPALGFRDEYFVKYLCLVAFNCRVVIWRTLRSIKFDLWNWYNVAVSWLIEMGILEKDMTFLWLE